MTDTKDNGGRAFPILCNIKDGSDWIARDGMTLRQYAAIHLQQPDSGLDWLDAMILAAKRDAVAGQALGGFLADPSLNRWDDVKFAEQSYCISDAMLEARK